MRSRRGVRCEQYSIRGTLRGLPAGYTPTDLTDPLMPLSWYSMYTGTLHAPCNATTSMVYLHAVYWSLATTTTIGFGDVSPANELEVGVLCLTIGISALLYSALIAYMSNLILSSDVNWTAYQQKVETIKSYMRHRKMPSTLQARIEEYLDYLWETQKGLDENAITAMLPATLRKQLSLCCNSELIATVPLFAGLSADVCAAIVGQLQPSIFVPGDFVIVKGEWADEMFLIYRGSVRLVEISEQQGYDVFLKDGGYLWAGQPSQPQPLPDLHPEPHALLKYGTAATCQPALTVSLLPSPHTRTLTATTSPSPIPPPLSCLSSARALWPVYLCRGPLLDRLSRLVTIIILTVARLRCSRVESA